MPKVRCKWYDSNGQPINGRCPHGKHCIFVHPTESEWERAPDPNPNAKASVKGGHSRGGSSPSRGRGYDGDSGYRRSSSSYSLRRSPPSSPARDRKDDWDTTSWGPQRAPKGPRNRASPSRRTSTSSVTGNATAGPSTSRGRDRSSDRMQVDGENVLSSISNTGWGGSDDKGKESETVAWDSTAGSGDGWNLTGDSMAAWGSSTDTGGWGSSKNDNTGGSTFASGNGQSAPTPAAAGSTWSAPTPKAAGSAWSGPSTSTGGSGWGASSVSDSKWTSPKQDKPPTWSAPPSSSVPNDPKGKGKAKALPDDMQDVTLGEPEPVIRQQPGILDTAPSIGRRRTDGPGVSRAVMEDQDVAMAPPPGEQMPSSRRSSLADHMSSPTRHSLFNVDSVPSSPAQTCTSSDNGEKKDTPKSVLRMMLSVAYRKAELTVATRDYERWKRTQNSEAYARVRKGGADKLDAQRVAIRERIRDLGKEVEFGEHRLVKTPDFSRAEEQEFKRLVKAAGTLKCDMEARVAESRAKYLPPPKKKDPNDPIPKQLEDGVRKIDEFDAQINSLFWEAYEWLDEWPTIPELMEEFKQWEGKEPPPKEWIDFENSLNDLKAHLNKTGSNLDRTANEVASVFGTLEESIRGLAEVEEQKAKLLEAKSRMENLMKRQETAQKERRALITQLNQEIQGLADYHQPPPPFDADAVKPLLDAEVQNILTREVLPVIDRLREAFEAAVDQRHEHAMSTVNQKLQPILDSTSKLMHVAQTIQAT